VLLERFTPPQPPQPTGEHREQVVDEMDEE
jgi:hypothetical protein